MMEEALRNQNGENPAQTTIFDFMIYNNNLYNFCIDKASSKICLEEKEILGMKRKPRFKKQRKGNIMKEIVK
jgi:hypothetical protein